MEFPPDSAMAHPDFDFGQAIGEQMQNVPGFVETFDPANPGMHETQTIDYAIVVKGESGWRSTTAPRRCSKPETQSSSSTPATPGDISATNRLASPLS
ncbi:cupin domain-containing protein [Nocardia bovistercoris]|uniref:Uncharacterized protein n=1 Tax=Nocardia bovistercoris TaxID=2785916 RepID=A0A931I9X2_9NOCA|nr:hypothetical protein [Nocardia bovistercoris]MBH0776372.1 hypothetical protein [Nocardia bovistercoris]